MILKKKSLVDYRFELTDEFIHHIKTLEFILTINEYTWSIFSAIQKVSLEYDAVCIV